VRGAGLQLITPHVASLVSALSSAAAQNPSGIVDLQPHFFEFTLGTTTDLLFGVPHSDLPARDRGALRDNFDYAAGVSAIRIRLAEFAWVYTPRQFKRACDVVRGWAGIFADRALKYREQHGDEAAKDKFPFILDLWEDMQNRDLVRDQLLHVLLAGRDTTACLLSWTL
jgi:cytochrome P450